MIRHLDVDQPLDLEITLYMGQDFRWCKRDDGWHSGVLSGNLILMRRTERGVEYKSDSDCDLTRLLSSYFRLDDDIEAIYADISRDDWMATLVEKYHGLRLLRQDPWECMVAYICSAPNSVKGITTCVEKIAEGIGQPIELCSDERYTFPTPEEVFGAGLERLKGLNLGLDRAEYIFAAANRVCCGDLDLEKLASQPYTETIRELKDIDGPNNGIGNKVSNCIAPFALEKLEAFPVDRNIGRALTEWYDDCPMPKDLSRLTDKRYDRHYMAIVCWAWKRFGQFAVYASQFLFREHWLTSNPASVDPCSRY